MPIIVLDYSGHYPAKRIEVTDAELETLRRLNEETYIFDTEEGLTLLNELSKRKNLMEETFTAYA